MWLLRRSACIGSNLVVFAGFEDGVDAAGLCARRESRAVIEKALSFPYFDEKGRQSVERGVKRRCLRRLRLGAIQVPVGGDPYFARAEHGVAPRIG
jgi:hypothetical protein